MARDHRDLRQMTPQPNGPDWDWFWRIFTSSKTITFSWGLENDAIAIWNTFGIKLISTKDERRFMDKPNMDRLLVNQMQCIDLQKINGHGPMPNLAGYIGDSEARTKPVSMKLTYAAICHMNCGQEKWMTGMALCQNIHDLGGEGTDEHLLEIFLPVRDLAYLQLALRRVDRENQWKERVGLYAEMRDRSKSLQLSVQADEALLQWAECYSKENNYIVMIGHRQFNHRNDVTTVKEILTPNQQTMWGIVSIIHELAELLQQRDRE